jgi:glycosyltransferase involved in cell wall biosynthesis
VPEGDLDMAVVVLSYGPRATLVDAVRSLSAQDAGAEIVVVHSGSGVLPADLTQQGVGVPVVVSSERLLPGAARNAGLAATKARFVAFLADDCIAGPGWVRERVARHREGATAVASALACHKPRDPVALAAHLSLYFRRMPRTQTDVALRYGVSYDRALFQRYGLFREDLESGEDTEFNQRLTPDDAPLWAPEVVTFHRGADTLQAFLQSQWRRGWRMAQAWRALGAFSASKVAGNAISRTGAIMREMWIVVEPRQRWAAALSVPLIIFGNLIYACGALTSGARG